jgi:hypothetical protein
MHVIEGAVASRRKLNAPVAPGHRVCFEDVVAGRNVEGNARKDGSIRTLPPATSVKQ